MAAIHIMTPTSSAMPSAGFRELTCRVTVMFIKRAENKTGTALRIAYDRMLAKVAITKSLNLPDLDGNPKYYEQLSLHHRLDNRL